MKNYNLKWLTALPVIGLIGFGICQESWAHGTKHADMESRLEENVSEEGIGAFIRDAVSYWLLVEAGVVYRDNNETGHAESDFSLVTVELGIGLEISSWVTADMVFLFEDPPFDTETPLGLDSGTITFSDTNRFPFFLSIGKMYVPFGALLTSFPDASLVDAPVTLTFGEIRETAFLTGYANNGMALCAYLFNGDINKDNDNSIDSFGVDARFTFEAKQEGIDAMIGASYLSNIADTDGFTDAFTVDIIEDHIGGFAAYLHMGYQNFFFDLEYMTALDDFKDTALSTTAAASTRPSVWNAELGFLCDWWKPLQVVFKYAGSHEAEALGTPATRYGIALNQEIHDNLLVSAGYLSDRFDTNIHSDGPNRQNTLFLQVAIVF